MTMRWSRLARELAGRSGGLYADLLAEQVKAAIDAAEVLQGAVTAGGDRALTVAADVAAIEQRGDDTRARLVQELSRALAPPLDREDLFRVSRSIDDVLDNLRDFARELQLYRPDDPAGFTPLLAATSQALGCLEAAVRCLDGSLSTVSRQAEIAKRKGNETRRLYEEALAALFARPLEMTVLRDRELLRRLDVVGLRLSEAVEALMDGVLKRGS